ncbi:unnamed protein product, partial [Amoebophrya sp. A120]|eukprot:GSA120T00001721001.1
MIVHKPLKMLSSYLRVVAFLLLISMPATLALDLQRCFDLATAVQYHCHKNPQDNMDAVLVEYVETKTAPAGAPVYKREEWVEKHTSKNGTVRDRIKTIAKIGKLLEAIATDATHGLEEYSAALQQSGTAAANPRLWVEAKKPVRRLQVSRDCLNARSALVAREECKGVLDVVLPMSAGEKIRHDIGDDRLLKMRRIIVPALQEFERLKAGFRSRPNGAVEASQEVLEKQRHLFGSPVGRGSESDSDRERELQEAQKLRDFRQGERKKFLEEQRRAEAKRNREEAARRKQLEENALRTAFDEAKRAGELRAPTADGNTSQAVDTLKGSEVPKEVLQRKCSPLTDEEKQKLQVANQLPNVFKPSGMGREAEDQRHGRGYWAFFRDAWLSAELVEIENDEGTRKISHGQAVADYI